MLHHVKCVQAGHHRLLQTNIKGVILLQYVGYVSTVKDVNKLYKLKHTYRSQTKSSGHELLVGLYLRKERETCFGIGFLSWLLYGCQKWVPFEVKLFHMFIGSVLC